MKVEYDIAKFIPALTNQSVLNGIIERVKTRRKELKYTQKELAKRSWISYASIRRFETTGEISFVSLLKIANTLGCLADFNILFSKETITNLKDY